MRAVVTRVNSASVTIDGEVHAKIGKGLLVLLGVHRDDTEKEASALVPSNALWASTNKDELTKKNGASSAGR